MKLMAKNFLIQREDLKQRVNPPLSSAGIGGLESHPTPFLKQVCLYNGYTHYSALPHSTV